MEGRSEILPKDVHRAIGILKQRGESFDLILMDPPYEKGLIQKTLMKLNSERIYHEDSILIIEHDRREPLPDAIGEWGLIRQRGLETRSVSFLKPRLIYRRVESTGTQGISHASPNERRR